MINESDYRLLSRDECKQILLDMFKYFDKLCRDNNINYTLEGGSLIGAIRHKGMIPWDDDIDIALTIENYRKLLDVIKKTDNNGSYKFFIPGETKNYPFPFLKLINTDTFCQEENMIGEIDNYGLFIDIFCLNYAPNDEEERRKFFKKILFYNNSLVRRKLNYDNPNFKKKCLRFAKNTYITIFGYKRMLKRLQTLFNTYSDTPTDYVMTCNPIYSIEREILKSSYFKEYTDVDFEDIKAMATKDYDEMLRNAFGDYMQLPPEDKRVSHGLKAWIKK